MRLCLQLLQYSFITLLWIQWLTAGLLIQGKGEMTIVSEVTAVLINRGALNTGTYFSFVSTG